jgi:murein DD-endopeptidase MepM/ murein hydrolase activator NlpD
MKALAVGGALVGLLTLSVFPALLATGDPSPIACGVVGGPIEVIVATIRQLESGGDYQARARGSTASGAYQFLDSTWADYGGYPSAWLAPPDVQDAKASDQVAEILNGHGGDVTAVPVVWYLGHLPDASSPEWDTVPAPAAGNTLTPRQYQTRWMAAYQANLATSGDPESAPPLPCGSGGSIPALDGDWSLPGPVAVLAATADQVNSSHHDYPAWDWLIPEGTPIYAVRSGTVTIIHNWPHNWWSEGCGTGGANGCDMCGVGLTIQDAAGVHWIYCHASVLFVGQGQHVAAGQQILASGDTGASGAPHLHFEIRVNGVQHCPQPLVQLLYYGSVGVDPATLPTSGCTF